MLGLAACGSNGTPSNGGGGAARASTPSATPLTTSTPGPASEQATLTGDPRITGPLTAGTVQFVRCEEPTLGGERIYAFENTADPTVGAFLTIGAGSIDVRLGSGSGAAYTERDFHGSGVTSFGAASGAQFVSSVTETTAAGGNKGTVEAITSISGSVSCGTFTPGGGAVSVDGATADGMISGALTSVRVTCQTADKAALVAGLTTVGSTRGLVNLAGGVGPSPFFVSVTTAAGTRQYMEPVSSSAYTFSASGVTYHATATLSTSAGTQSLTVSGTVTCGT